jgi:hypothetical protein
MRKQDTTLDWEFFLIDLDPTSSPPRIPLRLRLYAAARTVRALRIYRKHGWAVAHQYLRELCPGPGSSTYAALSPDTAVRLAWREVFTCQLIVRALMPHALCLPRSFALATYLSALGLPAEVTIARALVTAVPKNSFHSWTELYGVVINDNSDVQLGYRVLQRVTSRNHNTVPRSPGRVPVTLDTSDWHAVAEVLG